MKSGSLATRTSIQPNARRSVAIIYLADISAKDLATDASLAAMEFWKSTMVFVQPHVVGLSQTAITNAGKFVTEKIHAALAVFPAKSVAAIQGAARSATNPVHRALNSALGLALTRSAVQCLARYHAT